MTAGRRDRQGMDRVLALGRQRIGRRGDQNGIGAVIYEPLASGILSDKSLQQLRALWDGPWVESYDITYRRRR